MQQKLTYTFLSLLIFSFTAFAQKDTLNGFWAPNAAAGINISQIALSNWTQGGENQLTWTLTGNGGYDYFSKKWNFRNTLKITYGRTKLGSQNFRTNDNELFLELILSKHLGWDVDPFLSNSIRTPVTAGYNYKVEPFQKKADFFDPGYIIQSIGFTYDKHALFQTRLGFAVQETFTNKYRQYSDDPKTKKIEAFKLETGFESVTSFQQTIYDNMIIKSSLRLFTRFENLDVWDVRWDNSIIAKVNDLLNVNFNYLLIYKKAQSLDIQIKQTLQISFIYTIF
jgi:hypothetical protein